MLEGREDARDYSETYKVYETMSSYIKDVVHGRQLEEEKGGDDPCSRYHSFDGGDLYDTSDGETCRAAGECEYTPERASVPPYCHAPKNVTGGEDAGFQLVCGNITQKLDCHLANCSHVAEVPTEAATCRPAETLWHIFIQHVQEIVQVIMQLITFLFNPPCLIILCPGPPGAFKHLRVP